MLPLLFALAGHVPAPAPEVPVKCEGTCVPAGDMTKIVKVLQERQCFDKTKPEFKLDPINIIVDREGRVFFSGSDPQPYKLHMKWCNYEAEGVGKVKVLAAVQEPPTYGFRFRPKAFAGMLVLEPFREGKKPKDGIDAGLMLDVLYWKDLNVNVHAGFRSVGAGVGLDIFRNFGFYTGYALAWDGFKSNPEASLWFAFW